MDNYKYLENLAAAKSKPKLSLLPFNYPEKEAENAYHEIQPYIMDPSEIDPNLPEAMVFCEKVLEEYYRKINIQEAKKLHIFFVSSEIRKKTKTLINFKEW